MFTKGVKESNCVEVKTIVYFDQQKPSKEIVCFVLFCFCMSFSCLVFSLFGWICLMCCNGQSKQK